jgi:hypothetical protein
VFSTETAEEEELVVVDFEEFVAPALFREGGVVAVDDLVPGGVGGGLHGVLSLVF